MVKHAQTIRRQQPTNCFSVFDHFVGLALKGLTLSLRHYIITSKKYFFITESIKVFWFASLIICFISSSSSRLWTYG